MINKVQFGFCGSNRIKFFVFIQTPKKILSQSWFSLSHIEVSFLPKISLLNLIDIFSASVKFLFSSFRVKVFQDFILRKD